MVGKFRGGTTSYRSFLDHRRTKQNHMGFYTSLRAKMTVKPEYRPLLQLRHEHKNPDGTWKTDWGWDKVAITYPDVPALQAYIVDDRADFIPNGGLSGEPDDFSKTGETFSEFDPETGVWEFACSLKNYDDTIALFMRTIVAEMIEHIDYCESVAESWRELVMNANDHHWADPDPPEIKGWQDYATKYWQIECPNGHSGDVIRMD